MPAVTTSAPRGARAFLFVLAAVAVVVAFLPPVFPPTLPGLRIPFWVAIAAVSAGLAVLLTMRPDTPRPVVIGAGWALVTLTVLQGFFVGDLIGMFSTWLSVPALSLLAGQLRPKPRKALVAAHAISGGAWVGIGVVIVSMSVLAMTSEDVRTAAVTYQLMAVFDLTLLPWANFATLLTGIAVGMTTKWGLIQYYWVAIKLVITVAVLGMAFGFLHNALIGAEETAKRAVEQGGTVTDVGAVADVIAWGFGVATLSLVTAMVLSLYKPGGRTRRGRRVLEARRRQHVAA